MQVLYFAEKYLMASSTILDDGKEKELRYKGGPCVKMYRNSGSMRIMGSKSSRLLMVHSLVYK